METELYQTYKFLLYNINFQVKKTHNNVSTVRKLSSQTDDRLKKIMYCVRFEKTTTKDEMETEQ